ncbi:hypothetical protein QVD17_04398 [Tagetes erecta]|uniref:Uncharacterized protein n=1 Tax=Tagetes erecta TaxID=13708 RepID=A0AAD8PAE3_TARER|nr:hypothetical protein QVD17_04398 [Tagetes erecta]
MLFNLRPIFLSCANFFGLITGASKALNHLLSSQINQFSRLIVATVVDLLFNRSRAEREGSFWMKNSRDCTGAFF